MKTAGVEQGVQHLIPPNKIKFNYLEKELLQRFKPKYREEAVKIMDNLRAIYPKHNIDITLDNDNKLLIRAFGIDESTLHTVKQKWYMSSIGFLRNVRSAFVDMFNKEYQESVKVSEDKKFVTQMLTMTKK